MILWATSKSNPSKFKITVLPLSNVSVISLASSTVVGLITHTSMEAFLAGWRIGVTLLEEVLEVLDLVGLKNKVRQYPDQLSGGEQQRVVIARAIVNKPKLLICDEPTGNLDPDTSMEIMKVLEEINAMGTTIIMATHDRDIVDRMKKRVIILDHGRLVRDIEKGGYYNEKC